MSADLSAGFTLITFLLLIWNDIRMTRALQHALGALTRATIDDEEAIHAALVAFRTVRYMPIVPTLRRKKHPAVFVQKQADA